jgi:hypothetical protein
VAAKLSGPVTGPVISVLSFVCSIGNEPLAGMLWNGGISFGGRRSAHLRRPDLIGIMVIYRRYYGTRMMMLAILGVFHGAMVLAGYAIAFRVRRPGAGARPPGREGGRGSRQLELHDRTQHRLPARLGRAPSTVSREIRRNSRGRRHYRALAAQGQAQWRAARQKTAKRAGNAVRRAWVQEKLEQRWSPEQISVMLKREFPGDAEMRVSHETIYQAIHVQGRGALRRELAACLRTGGRCASRGARKASGAGRSPAW